MYAPWRLGLVLCLGFSFHLKSGAQEPVNLITARITSVKENDWQREMAQAAKPEGLRERLQARTLAELTGALNEDEVTFLSLGNDRAFATEWSGVAAPKSLKVEKTKKNLIGTEMRVKREVLDDEGKKVRLEITLTHDLEPPQMQPMSYATAAVGAERDQYTVSAPRFERLRWKGEILASQEERMLASFPSPQDASSRIVVFLQGGAAVSKSKAATTLRQTIYRVPELGMIEWLLKAPRNDAEVTQHLENAVVEGHATIVSNATLSMASRARAEAQMGTEHWVPTEMAQYFDQLYLVPSAFEPVLQGTRVSAQVSGCSVTFNNSFAPRPPLAVKWPTSWLRARDEKGDFTRAIHGWMDWHDRFEQQMDGSVLFCDAAPHLVAMMPPADQVWGTERQGRWLDVTVMQQPDWTAKPAPEDINEFVSGKEPAALPRRMFIGIALHSDAAHALLAARMPGRDDSPLLRDLLAQTRDGKARIVTCALMAHEPDRRNQTSARMHAYPTEMPSIPSAWQDVPVGTRLEQETDIVVLTQHLAPPARSEWKLARDMPEAIMWQPRFRTLSTSTQASALTAPGTHLLSAAAVPAVMADTDFPANETFLLFSHVDPGADAPLVTGQDYEIEALIFETSAQDGAAWQEVKPRDFESFSQQQLKSGRAKLLSHALMRTQPSPRVRLSLIEEYQTATAFDPPSKGSPSRMRPTALEALPVGLQFEGELTDDPDGTFNLNIKLQYSTAKPIEPGLEETLRLSADQKALYPGAKHEQDEWAEGLSLTPGKFHRLLPPSTTSGDKTTTRSAWVRVRAAK